MSDTYKELTPKLVTFIEKQKMFFVATAGAEGRINLSPKGLDTLVVQSPNEILWLNLTGSGNETAAHVLENGRMTLMFCAFDDKPLILRIYGKAQYYHEGDKEWDDYLQLFGETVGHRQVFKLSIEMALTSCGWGVPQYEYMGERHILDKWAKSKGEKGIKEYQNDTNRLSIDGKPTGLPE